MGFLSKLRHRDDDPSEQTCPRCRLPTPADASECPECKWDLREAYHPTEPVSNPDPA